ncbi:MAG: hypothetical protein Q8897_00110 [Sweet potato little leaf phytoplasma]|uniref:hypothetical protein n=1 Tax=Candidatus Phytoplasma australasiaticum TaxID=2754999 RepID=UPI002712AD86|nr:hypothetical protein [Sweet potato little leaf phytoplasma]MDO7986999.1 hypothetical protein [Sweet potato little leaf phytoplasma]MDV3139713.1 hypothetical protein [Sweet potato little leaf phytoplasma]MDV3151427.1 hypothetical protein [Sweet potato little leaf phytoplasma]MDV3160122.1 hypothetical protein [Sweet potato little leaf phytoplasma]MDV3168247.1 hypothetical protein [Sweet potato little leaf phytoplasma]
MINLLNNNLLICTNLPESNVIIFNYKWSLIFILLGISIIKARMIQSKNEFITNACL